MLASMEEPERVIGMYSLRLRGMSVFPTIGGWTVANGKSGCDAAVSYVVTPSPGGEGAQIYTNC
jgi:hypothetical protein